MRPVSRRARAGLNPAPQRRRSTDREGVITLRVLITGGAGFIGSHLSDAYLERGDEVFIIDDLSTGSIDNIQHLKKHPRFHYTIENVQNYAAVAELVDQ